ncbi:MAG: nitroreductase family protein, partial [bacterium]
NGRDMILRGAPHIVVVHSDKSMPMSQGSCTIAASYLELAAYGFGIGACWAGFFAVAAASYPPLVAELNLPKNNQVFGAMMIGAPKYSYLRIPPRNPAKISWL